MDCVGGSQTGNKGSLSFTWPASLDCRAKRRVNDRKRISSHSVSHFVSLWKRASGETSWSHPAREGDGEMEWLAWHRHRLDRRLAFPGLALGGRHRRMDPASAGEAASRDEAHFSLRLRSDLAALESRSQDIRHGTAGPGFRSRFRSRIPVPRRARRAAFRSTWPCLWELRQRCVSGPFWLRLRAATCAAAWHGMAWHDKSALHACVLAL